ncbi:MULTISPECIES: hypothetical protein [unclassified Mesorhizobium]|uniref:hypothetical protein n=1 Tax=unclassified Mesorhizobium TaxID=325217 RepID=UPI001FEFB394|nr:MULTISPECIES: hypothetical protein [unclassified Mesorhizobium]
MHRRGFLAAGLATVLASPRALAQTKMDDMSMPGMDMGGHAGHDMAAMRQDAVTLPDGQALRDLPLLANETDRPACSRRGWRRSRPSRGSPRGSTRRSSPITV